MEQVKIFKCIVLWYKQFIDKIIYIVRFENMNKYLVAIVFSILSITSQAEAWIQTEMCNKTGRDITLYKPSSSDKPSYANGASKDNSPWLMFYGERTSGYNDYIENITVPNTNDCFNKTIKITVWDNYWRSPWNDWEDWDFMTLCDLDKDCKNGTYSLQFYNGPGDTSTGVIPGYAYYYNDGKDICGRESWPCVPFINHAKTTCYYKKSINKNDGNLGIDYIYKCFVE